MKNTFSRFTFLLILASPFFTTSLFAQVEKTANDTTLITQCIENLFDGMRAGDSAMVHLSFRDDVRLVTSFSTRTKKSELNMGDLEEFLGAVAAKRTKQWDEKIYSMEIRIDENLAQVWTEYAFFMGEHFSHCGVNAFHLIKQENVWKIFNLTDTRRITGCRYDKKIYKE